MLCVCFVSVTGQQLSEEIRNDVLKRMFDLIDKNYVDAKVGSQIVDSLESKRYSETDFNDFRRTLTRDLRNFSDDQHFRVFYSESNDFSTTITDGNRQINYGFEKIEILDGNISYLRISYFEDPKLAGPIAHSALTFLSNTDGIIIDLRDNHGGRKVMVQLLLSYFFEESSKHLYDIIGRHEEFHGYTEAYLPGKRLDQVPLYILINEASFSAAEMFAFILQKQKRAVILGKPTPGGGHSVGNYPLSHGFSINLPVGKVIDPKTGDGWEKIGVKPDVEISNNDEFVKRTHLMALKVRIKESHESNALFQLKWRADILQSDLEPIQLDKKTLKRMREHMGEGLFHMLMENSTTRDGRVSKKLP